MKGVAGAGLCSKEKGARRAGNGKAGALESAVGRVTRGSWGGRVGAIAAGKPGQASAVFRAPSPPRPPATTTPPGDLGLIDLLMGPAPAAHL